jgi:PIN domain nuclease of toxin-antitoxin system
VKLLLDTHVFIWWFNEPEKLSKKVLAACEDNKNELTLSVASIWEMQVKMQLGKLRLTHSIKDLISIHWATYDLQILPIFLNHVLALDNLPVLHRDPFDRILIAQASAEKQVIVTKDQIFKEYPVQLLW